MSILWQNLIDCQNQIIDIFNKNCEEIEEPGLEAFHKPESGWINRVWANKSVRRAHIDVVDARHSKGLWMMHVCVFPMVTNPSPIYGFDVISGKNKMTGAFHDFSPGAHKIHPLLNIYFDSVKNFNPNKKRELPQWAKNIFTDKMLAASNVNTIDEAQEIISIALKNLSVYMLEVGKYDDYTNKNLVCQAQNYYCANQRKNPHTPRVMQSLGLDEELVEAFCNNLLFPPIYTNV